MPQEWLNKLAQGMTAEEQERLKKVYKPQRVATPLSNALGDMCITDDGEIRCYGKQDDERAYLASRDGFTWKLHKVTDLTRMCSGTRLPWTAKWVMTYAIDGEGGFQGMEMPTPPDGLSGWQAAVSTHGPGDTVAWRPVFQQHKVTCPRLPLALESRRRILVCANLCDQPGMRPIVARSDDDGETWHVACLKAVPPHEVKWPHKGARWQNCGMEGTILERRDGSLLLFARTSQDEHYQYESFDGGETWTDPVPSGFHATLTMPTLFRCQNGDSLLFWCNTQPLPENDHTQTWPALNPGEISGYGGEDVFTNRDANHCAISRDDGRTWQGFRELMLNPIRNASDFRTCAGNQGGLDKSIHQFQAIELPYGKILLAYGQHTMSRGLLIFDPSWLLETSREENFRHGLGDVSTQVYLKSVSGNFRKHSGHCAWNRMSGAVLMPDPDGNFEEALYISASGDLRLFSPMQGVTWNFPAAVQGKVEIRLRTEEEGVRLTLTDRWFNPCDHLAGAQSAFTCNLDGRLPCGAWQDICLEWNESICRVLWNGQEIERLDCAFAAPNGISYLLIQSQPAFSGKNGTYVKKMSMRKC